MKDITKSIISSHNGWDEAGDFGDVQYYNAVLAIDTKKFKKGDMISCVTFLMSQSVCQLYQPSGPQVNNFTPSEVVEEFPIQLIASV